jgi:hypothetical protein
MIDKMKQLTAMNFTDQECDNAMAFVDGGRGNDVELYSVVSREWIDKRLPPFVTKFKYRTVPHQAQPPWRFINSKYNWCSMDADGVFYFFEFEPRPLSLVWSHGGGIISSLCLEFPKGNMPWNKSLTKRPHWDGA